MAAATVDSSPSDRHLNHLHSESIPLIDLRLLSQSELFSLSLCSSSSSSSLHHHQNDADVSTLKIDRSVFNESAGSRKQTFSRLRLAPRNNSQFFPSSSIKASFPHQTADQTCDEETSQIVSLLKSLFGVNSHEVNINDDNLVSVPIQYNSFLDSNEALHNVSIGMADYNAEAEMKQIAIPDSDTKKRKRGRPRKNEIISISNNSNYNLNEDEEKVELVTKNMNGTTKELVALGSVEDPYVEELRRRTTGMQTREQLLEFLQGLGGVWLSNRKKRTIVDASVLGDVLPRGWKLMLCIKKRAGYFWITCRRYISPNGQQFMSCKEASSYLNFSLGLEDASQLNLDHVDGNVQLMGKKSSGSAADLTRKADNDEDAPIRCPELPLTKSVEYEKQTISLKAGTTGQVQTVGKYKCHKCTIVFDEPDDLLQHLLASHQRTSKRIRQETSMNEEVIIKNGKYECQFCHKPFEERHRYNGHLGNHIKDYFKRIEASIQRSIIPPSVAVHPSVVKIQESTEIDMGSGSKTNDEISYAVLNCKIEENTSAESQCSKQGIVCSMTDDKAGDTNDVVAVETNVCVGAESVLSKSDNVSICESSNETNVPKCTREGTNKFGMQEEGSQNCSLTIGREQISALDNNENRVCIALIEGNDQKLGSDNGLLALNSIEKVLDGENIKDRLLSSTINGMKIPKKDLLGKDKVGTGFGSNCLAQEDVASNVKDQRKSLGCLLIPAGRDQRYVSANNVHELSTSTRGDMMYERGSEGCLPSSFDEKTCVSDNKVNQVFTRTVKESRFDEVGKSGKNVLTVGFGGKNITTEDTVTGNELESSLDSCSVIPSWNEKMSCTENDVYGTCRSTRKNHLLEKNNEGRQLTLFGPKKYLGSENTGAKVSADPTEVPSHDGVLCFKNCMRSKDVDLIAGHVTTVQLESSSKNSLHVPSGNELTFALKDDGALNVTTKNLMQDKNYDSKHKPSCGGQILDNDVNMASLVTVDQPKYEEVKSLCNGETHIAFDHSRMQWDADGMKSTNQESCSKDCSLIISGSQRKFATEDNVTGLYSSTLDEHKQASAGSSIRLSNSEQDWSVRNNSNRVLTGEVQEEPRLEDFNPGKSGSVTGFNSNTQATENAISEFMWKTDEENNLLASFADTSSRLVHSSGCFTTYDLMSDKGGNELFGEKLSGISGFEGLRSGNMENMEYNFMTNHSDESKIFLYDAEIARGLGSSVWLEKEALPLLPKIASRRHVPASCVWCRNEFQYEAFESEAQIGSLSFRCAACKAKFSGQFNLL